MTDRNDSIIDMYNRNIDMVYRLCYLYMKNKHDAEDAAQSVFFKVLKNEIKFDDMNYEKAWFITVSKNCCKDMLKSTWRRKRGDLSEVRYCDTEEEKDFEYIKDALMKLSEKYKTVLYLYYFEELRIKEISCILKLKESTIQTRLDRGRKKLKKIIQKER